MAERRALPALGLILLAAVARGDAWSPTDVGAAARWQQEEAARASAYREQVARGDIRGEAAPRPRRAPELPPAERAEPPQAPTPREIVELLEHILGTPVEPERDREGRRVEPRGASPRPPSADDWWGEEQRRLEDAQ
jgi:hypothetical protein